MKRHLLILLCTILVICAMHIAHEFLEWDTIFVCLISFIIGRIIAKQIRKKWGT